MVQPDSLNVGDNVIWGSDYPHPDGSWPDSLPPIKVDLRRLDGTVQGKITWENAGKLYGFREKGSLQTYCQPIEALGKQ